MSLLHAGVDTSLLALWLGHAGVRSTDAYVHADMTIKEKALALTTPTTAQPGRYRPPDKVLVPRKPVTMPSRNPPTSCITRPDGLQLGIVAVSA